LFIHDLKLTRIESGVQIICFRIGHCGHKSRMSQWVASPVRPHRRTGDKSCPRRNRLSRN